MREVVVNRLYRHFKGNFYYVKDVAQHTESGEMMVVYQAMYGEYGTFVRPVDMFLEEIDPSREDNVTGQKYRFEIYNGQLNNFRELKGSLFLCQKLFQMIQEI